MLEELVAQPHCLHVHVDIWQLNMFKLNYKLATLFPLLG